LSISWGEVMTEHNILHYDVAELVELFGSGINFIY